MQSLTGVIDLGTNTFHLLIVRVNEKGHIIEEVFRKKVYVMLAKSGKRELTGDAYKRAIDTLIEYALFLKTYEVKEVYAFATEGIRKAENSKAFIADVARQSGLQINCISGDEEAAFIYYGVKNALQNQFCSIALLMDIGGGSTEFIIANQNEIFWKQSFPLGAGVLKNKFHRSEPIDPKSIREMHDYCEETLKPLFEEAQNYPSLDTLIGTSGTFDTLMMIDLAQKNQTKKQGQVYDKLSLPFVSQTIEQLARSTRTERENLRGMEKERASLIVVGTLLVRLIIEKFNINQIYQSDYAIKEGIIWCTKNHKDYLKAIVLQGG